MTDLAFKNASAHRDRLASEINQLNQRVHDIRGELKAVDEWIAGWHRFAATASSSEEIRPERAERAVNVSPSETAKVVENAHPERTRTTGNPKKEIVAANARRIIEEAGQPVSRADLFKELGLRGIHIGGKDPEQVLSTMMWRTREAVPVIRLSSGGYWLPEVPHPASGYSPDTGRDSIGTRRMPTQDEIADLSDDSGDDENDYEPSHDDERDAQIDREVDDAVEAAEREANVSQESEPASTPKPLLDDDLPPPRPRPARVATSGEGVTLAELLSGGSRR